MYGVLQNYERNESTTLFSWRKVVLLVSTFTRCLQVPRWIREGTRAVLFVSPSVNLCPCCPNTLERCRGNRNAAGKLLFARNPTAAQEKQNCSSGLTDFHLNEVWSEDISGGVLSPDDFTLACCPVQMPGYGSWMRAQISQRASAQVLDASYETSTDGCKVVFKALLGMWKLAPKLFWNAVHWKDVI